MKIHNPIVGSPFSIKVLFFLYVFSVFASIYAHLNPAHAQPPTNVWDVALVLLTFAVLTLLLMKHPKTWIVGFCEQFLVLAVGIFVMGDTKETVMKNTQEKTLELKFPPLSQEQLEEAAKSSIQLAILTLITFAVLTSFLWYRSRKYFTGPAASSKVETA